jgi:hypothetical protein
MTLLSGVLDGGQRFPFTHRTILVTTVSGKQKGYNVGNAYMKSYVFLTDRLVINGAFKYLPKGSPLVERNWRMVYTPIYAALEDVRASVLNRKPFKIKSEAQMEYSHMRFELDEKTERELMVWLDQQES